MTRSIHAARVRLCARASSLMAVLLLALPACQVISDEPGIAGKPSESPPADIGAVAGGFLDDGSFLVEADDASPGLVISAPFTLCSPWPRPKGSEAGPSYAIPFSALLVFCTDREPTITLPGDVALTDRQRAENYRRVADCTASQRVGYRVGALDVDPCPAALGAGWRFPIKSELVGLTASQRRTLADAWRSARDGTFSSVVVLARDGDGTLFAVDVSPNGRHKSLGVGSLGDRGYGGFTPRCVRAPGAYRPAPALSGEAQACLSTREKVPITAAERQGRDARRAQASRPLYPEVVAFGEMVDRLPTVPELDVPELRRKLRALEPALRRIRADAERRRELGDRLFAASRDLAEKMARQRAAPGDRALAELVQRETQDIRKLALSQYDDDGAARNHGAVRDAFNRIEAHLIREERRLEEAMREMEVEGTSAPDAWRSRVEELGRLRVDLDDIEKDLAPPPRAGKARRAPPPP